MITNSIICPYCKTDHCQEKLDYVTIIDEITSDDPDKLYEHAKSHKKKWIEWWKRHMSILY